MCRFFSLKYQTGYLYYAVYAATHTCTKQTKVVNSVQLLGGSGGVVSFLDFCPALLVHGCMVYTELAPKRLQFHVAPAMPAL